MRKGGCFWAICGVWSGALHLAALAQAPDSVVLSVAERGGVARSGEMVASGVPLPRSWKLSSVSALRIRNSAGTAVPAQFHVLARWGAAAHCTTAPIRWVLVQLPATVASSGTATYMLDRGGPGPAPITPLILDTSTAGRIRVNTGAAVFDIKTSSFNLIDQVTISGQAMLAPLTVGEALQYRPAGSSSLVRGAVLPDLTPRATSVIVERSGPLAAVIRARGSLLNTAGQAVLDYTARLYFAAGRTDVRLDFTVENNHPLIEDVEGQPANGRDQRTTHSVYIGSLQLRWRLASGAGALHAMTERTIDVAGPATTVTVHQESSGTDFWNAYVGNVGYVPASAHPRLHSYCSYRGYRIEGGGLTARTGNQAEGWIAVSREGTTAPALCVAVRDFWQNFPKTLGAGPDGTVYVDLFPRGTQFYHNFRVGEQKTHSLLLSFAHGRMSQAEGSRRARAFQRPLFAAAPAAWYIQTGALGDVPAENLGRWRLYERFCRTTFEPNPDFNPDIHDPNLGNRTLLDVVAHYNLYGWQDFGDFPLDYEPFGDNQAGQLNLKYWYLYGLLIHFCRSGDLRWMDVALPAARHLADVDFLHIPDEGASHWAHGGYFGHCYHDEPGNWNPNRNYGGPTLNLFYAVPDLLLAYHLTGEHRFLDTAREGLTGIVNVVPFSEAPGGDLHKGLGREVTNFLFAYIEGYRQTGDAALLNKMREVLAKTTNFSDKGWVANPRAYAAAHPENPYIRMFIFVQQLWTLGRYLDFLSEYGWADTQGVRAALRAYCDFVLNWATEEYAPGKSCFWYDYYFDGVQWNTGDREYNYRDINNWTLMMADALAYAWKYSGHSRYLREAEKYYRTGTVDIFWEGCPPVFAATKDLINSLNWGLVYMRMGELPAAVRHWRRLE